MSRPVGTSAYGPVLRELAQRAGKTQAQVCRETGLSSSYVSQLFGGRVEDPMASRLYLVAHALGATVDDVIAMVEAAS